MGEPPAVFSTARDQQGREMEGNCSRNEAFSGRRFSGEEGRVRQTDKQTGRNAYITRLN